MKVLFLRAVFGALALTTFSAHAQMHKVAKPEQVVRAIGVYEWTGDLTKPKASRLIPVSIFIEGKLEDAGVYVARPVPFALLTGNVYELQDAGIDKALLDLAYARHLQAVDSTGDMAWDDGWFGYGSVKPLAAPRKAVALKPSKNLPVITGSKGSTASADNSRPKLQTKSSTDTASSGADQSKTTASDSSSGTSSTSSNDPDRPTMKRRSASDSSDSGSTGTATPGSAPSGSTTTSASTTSDTGSAKSSGSASSSDPDRPTMKRRSDDTADTTTTSSTTSPAPADDPDRPTMKRRTDSSGTDASTTTSSGSTPADSGTAKSTESTPADDPDRPTMKRRPSDSTTDSTTTASTSGSGSADDPDRPTLKRHSPDDPKRKNGSDSASVSGVGSLNDDPNRPMLHHGKPTSAMTETDLPKLVGMPTDLHQMVAVSDAVNRDPHEFALAWDDEAQRAAVLQKVQALARAQLVSYGAKPATTSATAKPSVTAKKTTTITKAHRAAAASVATPEPLLDEELKAYMLSYGGAATYVYTAHTGGTGAALRYVTIVVQADGLGELKPAIQSVTDAAHLDRTPRMRFVDVVDAEASNRASLLFELRGQNSRQFGLYRVIASHSEQTFLTGTTQ